MNCGEELVYVRAEDPLAFESRRGEPTRTNDHGDALVGAFPDHELESKGAAFGVLFDRHVCIRDDEVDVHLVHHGASLTGGTGDSQGEGGVLEGQEMFKDLSLHLIIVYDEDGLWGVHVGFFRVQMIGEILITQHL